jgi:hypothetical protein
MCYYGPRVLNQERHSAQYRGRWLTPSPHSILPQRCQAPLAVAAVLVGPSLPYYPGETQCCFCLLAGSGCLCKLISQRCNNTHRTTKCVCVCVCGKPGGDGRPQVTQKHASLPRGCTVNGWVAIIAQNCPPRLSFRVHLEHQDTDQQVYWCRCGCTEELETMWGSWWVCWKRACEVVEMFKPIQLIWNGVGMGDLEVKKQCVFLGVSLSLQKTCYAASGIGMCCSNQAQT